MIYTNELEHSTRNKPFKGWNCVGVIVESLLNYDGNGNKNVRYISVMRKVSMCFIEMGN